MIRALLISAACLVAFSSSRADEPERLAMASRPALEEGDVAILEHLDLLEMLEAFDGDLPDTEFLKFLEEEFPNKGVPQ